MKEIFKKPKWLRPEINQVIYWVHILILALTVQLILTMFGYDVGNYFSIYTLHLAIAISLADIIAHTVLGFD